MSVDLSSNEAGVIPSTGPRRRSGRVVKRPERFATASSPTEITKRKRRDNGQGDDGAATQTSDEEESDSTEGEPDEEELRDQRKISRKKRTKTSKPLQKKPKTNGETLNLAIRPAKAAKKGISRPRKAPIRPSVLADSNAEGLYADLFAHGSRLEDVAAQWINRFNTHSTKAVAEVVNLVLRASGCHAQVDEHDIGDPDNCAHRLGEIQDDYQQQDISEYPVNAKRGGAAFRNALHGFFVVLVQTIASTRLMFEEDNELMVNIQVWICTLSSATNRPFRHTSTVACLGATTGLATVANDIAEKAAKMTRQRDTESRKARRNASRISTIENEVAELQKQLEHVKSLISDWFDTVYVHRYRDVDPKIRMECCEGLAGWIMTYPDMFFDGVHLRYLGWLLSDINEGTRGEVLKQLTKLFSDKDKHAGLKIFTERFRPRMVETATRDAHANVRILAVELLDILREAGFLEPQDVDIIGKLIYDTEPKVRKSVASFFAENVTSAYESLIEDMGGEEALEEALASTSSEGYDNPRLDWLKMKCLVQQLMMYDEDTALPSQIERIAPGGTLGLNTTGVESRFSLAAQALYDLIPEIRTWEVLAGYLLYDHSQSDSNDTTQGADALLKLNCKLEESEEVVLLDILNAVLSLRLQRSEDVQKDKKKTKAQRNDEDAEQEEIAKKLTLLIPQLLKKFGALPEAAALCLRLERKLNLDVFQALRQRAALIALLDDINRQFLTHHNEKVLNEAIESMLHAQNNDSVKELVELKTQTLWEDLISTLEVLGREQNLSIRGNVQLKVLTGMSGIILKMSELAKISEPTVLDHVSASMKSRKKSHHNSGQQVPPIAMLIDILSRGSKVSSASPEAEAAENALLRHTMSLLLLYFLWKCRHCSTHIEANTTIPSSSLTKTAESRDKCLVALMNVIASRKGSDELRIEAANLLLDIYNMFRALKSLKTNMSKGTRKPAGRASTHANDDWEALCQDIDGSTIKILVQILTSLENDLGKRLRKRLEEPEIDDDPIDTDDEPESSGDEDVEDHVRDQKQIRILLAEERLCTYGSRLIQGVQVGTLDGDGDFVRTRLERNKTKLTQTWKEVVGHLDVNKHAKVKGAKKGQTAKKTIKANKSKEIVIDDESEEEEDQDEQQEEEVIPEDEEDHINGEAADPIEDGTAEPEDLLGD